MNIVLLYLLLLKGTVTAFAGLASLPVIQESLVNHHHALTNERLNETVVITRSSPGPVGLYIVSVGYFAAGLPGAVAGWLAMITPALLIIPLVHLVGRRMEHPRVRSVLQTAVIASAGLLLAAAIPLGRDGLTGPVTWAIAAVCFVLLLTTKIDTLWMILAAALVSLTASSVGLLAYLCEVRKPPPLLHYAERVERRQPRRFQIPALWQSGWRTGLRIRLGKERPRCR